MLRAVLAGCAASCFAGTAAAERPVRAGIGAGGSLLFTGDGGDRLRFDAVVDIKPRSRYGALVAWRGFDADHRGLVLAGIVYEGAAARPRLVVDLHAEAGADLDARAPVAGGGVRSTLTIVGPLAVALDGGAYLVIDGVDGTRLQLQSSAIIVLGW